MYFKKLTLESWRQFGVIELPLNRRVTIFTGANGAGKTAALNFLAANIALIPPLVASFSADSHAYIAGVQIRSGQTMQPLFLVGMQVEFEGGVKIPVAAPIAKIQYSDDSEAQIAIPFEVNGATFNVIGHEIKRIDGLHFPAFQSLPMYARVENDDLVYRADSEEPVSVLMLRAIRNAMGPYGQDSCWKEVKLTLMNWLKLTQESPLHEEQWFGFLQILRNTLPHELAFQGFELQGQELIVVTNSVKFVVDASSGGISKIISMVWQLFLLSTLREEAVITIDEPENHLHPSMQQALMHGLVTSFPAFQFVVATHSPFVITGVKDAFVYAFKTEGIDLFVSRLDQVPSLGLTPDEVLKDVLGLPFTMPIWAASEIEVLVNKFVSDALTPERIAEFIQAVEEAGLTHVIPYAVRSLRQKVQRLD